MIEPGETSTAILIPDSEQRAVKAPKPPVVRTAEILLAGAKQAGLDNASVADRAAAASTLVTMAAQANKVDKPPEAED